MQLLVVEDGGIADPQEMSKLAVFKYLLTSSSQKSVEGYFHVRWWVTPNMQIQNQKLYRYFPPDMD